MKNHLIRVTFLKLQNPVLIKFKLKCVPLPDITLSVSAINEHQHSGFKRSANLKKKKSDVCTIFSSFCWNWTGSRGVSY